MLWSGQMGGGQALALIAATACFASFLWGAVFFFRRSHPKPPAVALLSVSIALTIAAHIAAILGFYDHGAVRLAIGLAGYAASFGLFWYAVGAARGHALRYAFMPGAPDALIRSGPFARIRHPFYTAYLIAWLAGWVATGQWWVLVPTAITAALLFRAAAAEEAGFLASPLADQYRDYQTRTGRFLPRFVRSRS